MNNDKLVSILKRRQSTSSSNSSKRKDLDNSFSNKTI